MKALKTILILIYPILIILLLLSLKDCSNNSGNIEEPGQEQIDEPEDEQGDEQDEASGRRSADQPAEDQPNDDSLVRQAERTGNSGDLKVTLLWDFPGDIDLHVTQPNGRKIYFSNKRDLGTGGYLDVDNRNGGSGAAENIYWERPRNGQYQVEVVYYSASQDTGVVGSGVCSIVVFNAGAQPETYNFEMNTVNQRRAVTTITVN